MRQLFALVALAFASSARADTTAIYENPATKFWMTIQIASNGDIRSEVPGRIYYFVAGKDYFAVGTDTGVIVMSLDDMAKVMGEKFAELSAKTKIPAPSPRPIALVQKGTVKIGKWSGDAYYTQAANGQLSPRPVTVISHDPSLAELGRAMERQVAKSERVLGQVMGARAPNSNMDQVVSTGAPVLFAGAELQSVSFDPVPKDAFILPAEPATLDAVRKRMSQH